MNSLNRVPFSQGGLQQSNSAGRLVNGWSAADRCGGVTLISPARQHKKRRTAIEIEQATGGFQNRLRRQIQVKQHRSWPEGPQLPKQVAASRRTREQQPLLLGGVAKAFAQREVVADEEKEIAVSLIKGWHSGLRPGKAGFQGF